MDAVVVMTGGGRWRADLGPSGISSEFCSVHAELLILNARMPVEGSAKLFSGEALFAMLSRAEK